MRVRAGITAWLLLLILVPTIPLLGFSTYSALLYAQGHRLELEADLVRRTDNLAVATRDRLAKTLGTLNGLAVSDAAQAGDITALYSSARRVQERDPDIAAITLIAADDKTLFITLHPLGEEIQTSDLATVREVFATGKPVLSGPIKLPVSEQIVVALGVPIVRDGKVAYCLQGIISSRVLNTLLQSGNPPEGWIAAIVAANGLLVARSRTPELFVGQKASARVIAALDQRRLDIFDGYTRESIPTRTALRAVGDWGWYVALAVPRQELMAPLDRDLRELALLALALVGASCAAVIYLSRRIGRSLRQTVDATHSVLAGNTPQPLVSGIVELDRMHEALTHMDAYGRILEQQVSSRTHDLLEAKNRIATFASELDASIEAERQRLSREVHDQIGAVLTGIKMIVRSLPPGTLPAPEEKTLIDALDTGVATARRIASELRPPLIDDIGLQAAVEHLLDGILRPARVVFSVKLGDCGRLTSRQSLAVFRIIQEAATNVARHANAEHFAIDARVSGHDYEVTMIDDGIGLPAAHARSDRLGMLGMQERAQLLGGRLTWVSQPQQGTAFTLTIPLEPTDS